LRGRAGGAVRVARGRWPVSGSAWTRYPAGRRVLLCAGDRRRRVRATA
jgi:hypothetical protein